MKRRAFFLALAVGAALLSGCSTLTTALKPEHVKSWERESLSLPGMQINPEPLIKGCDDHIYFSREASKGGSGFGGGGCGCN